MHFHEFKQSASKAIDSFLGIWNDSEFRSFTHKMMILNEKFLNVLQQEKLEANVIHQQIVSFNNQISELMKQTDIGKLYVDIDSLKQKIKTEIAPHPLFELFIEEINRHFDTIWKILNQISRLPNNYKNVMQLIRSSVSIDTTVTAIGNCRQYLDITEKTIAGDVSAGEDEELISIGFGTELLFFKDLLTKFKLLEEIHLNVCYLFGINNSNESLKIVKIESGTLFTQLIGKSQVVEFMVWLFKGTIKFFHRKFTIEGKKERLSLDIKELDKQINIQAKLKALLPEDKYKQVQAKNGEILQRCSTILAKRTQQLLENETRIRINDELLQLEGHDQRLYLEDSIKKIEE
jgi:hypothetical protein